LTAEELMAQLQAHANESARRSLHDRYPQYEIGEGSYGGLEVKTWGTGDVLKVGKFCSFSFGVSVLLGGEHRADWASTFPFPAMPEWPEAHSIEGHPRPAGSVTIGSDVWVGAEAMILGGSTIGHGAVVSARTVVSGRVAPYSVVGGNPMRLLRWRFPLEICEQLLELTWWDWPRERIAKALPFMLHTDVAGFVDVAKRGLL